MSQVQYVINLTLKCQVKTMIRTHNIMCAFVAQILKFFVFVQWWGGGGGTCRTTCVYCIISRCNCSVCILCRLLLTTVNMLMVGTLRG